MQVWRRYALMSLLVLLLSTSAGCLVDPAYLAVAKERYELKHGLKARQAVVEETDTSVPVDEKKVHPPYRNMECNKCHDLTKGSELLAKGADLCWFCHKKNDFERSRQHGPVAVGDCSGCHTSHETAYPNHTTAGLPSLCLGCHDFAWGGRDGFREGFTIHQPVREGKCPKCHDPHGGDRRFFLKSERGDLCRTCHTDPKYGKGVTHGPVAIGDCLACHDPHASQAARLLRQQLTAELCFRCHPSGQLSCDGGRGRRDCLACHKAHETPQGVGG
ncbi:MAG: cytochrome c3 family protein [Chitinophagales bacterium]